MATKKPIKKKTAVKRTSASKKAKNAALKSFRVYPDTKFLEFKISRQTVYWTILVSFIILMQLWILKTQFEVIQVTDSINALIEL
jgi:hypothetical protein